MIQPRRLPNGGLIDRDTTLCFSFNGRLLEGYAGDSLASALLANNISTVARSFKYHRARGILSAGLEEPNALISCVHHNGDLVPNLKATEVKLEKGLLAYSQNCWPSVKLDLGAVLQVGAAVLSAGFYYKTFMWPPKGWHKLYEKMIRHIAGQGRASTRADGRLYDRRNAHCDLLIVGAGPAGLSAALAAADSGFSVMLVEQDSLPGGSTLWEAGEIDSMPASTWREQTMKTLRASRNIRIKCNTLAFGHYDHGRVMAVEAATDGVDSISWRIRCRYLVLACGASERPLIFPGNDRPGIMLAASVRQYIHRYAVAPGQRAFLAVTDPAQRVATRFSLEQAGIDIVAELQANEHIQSTRGRLRLSGVTCCDDGGARRHIACDLLCSSAGWNPNVQLGAQLTSTASDSLQFDCAANALLPSAESSSVFSCGAGRGLALMIDCADDGKLQTQRVLAALGGQQRQDTLLPAIVNPAPRAQFHDGHDMAFVDLQNDVTRNDLEQAVEEGYQHIELLKRYTTLGMGTDQGKTGWSNAILEISRITGENPNAIGHTTFRPPFSPVSLGALVGAEVGQHMTPLRHTPFQRVFKAAGCVFQTSGDWLYSRYFPQPGETMPTAIRREVLAVRNAVGCVDMSTLGKVDVRGRDALEFLQRIYCNNLDSIQPRQLRYVLMLREDGLLFDDGTVARLGDHHYLVTMTTANTTAVWRWMNKLLQIHWPGLDVQLTSVSDHWASLAIAGPQSRNLLRALNPDFSCDRDSFPFARVRQGKLGQQIPCRVFSVSFSGELSYEINVPAGFASTLFQRVIEQGAEFGITPYGLEALDILRIEKGHLSIGTEIDGRTTAADLGLARMVSTRKSFIGSSLLQRPQLQRDDRRQLIGLLALDDHNTIPPAAHLCDQPWEPGSILAPQGSLTAAIDSPTLGRSIALALLHNGLRRLDETLWAVSPLTRQSVAVRVTRPCFVDIEGRRVHE
jgi:heterotetrameric sarcosine oxidase alpha subunit